jgi:hypothetical protein
VLIKYQINFYEIDGFLYSCMQGSKIFQSKMVIVDPSLRPALPTLIALWSPSGHHESSSLGHTPSTSQCPYYQGVIEKSQQIFGQIKARRRSIALATRLRSNAEMSKKIKTWSEMDLVVMTLSATKEHSGSTALTAAP